MKDNNEKKDVRSQFVLGGYTNSNFVLDSLSVMAADTRGGLDNTTATRLAAMQGYATANPDKVNMTSFETYVGKIVGGGSESRPVATTRVKPSTVF
jgi:hypothetical protein